MFISLPLVM